jgi:hypothetical protein
MARRWSTLAWLVAAFGCGLIDAAAWAILAAAWGLFSGFAFAGNSASCGAAFLAGKALAAVVA